MNVITVNNSIIIHDSLESGTFQWIIEPHAQAIIIHFVTDDCIAKIDFMLGNSSTLYYHPIIIGGLANELRLSMHLQKSAHAIINGAYALTDKQQCTLVTKQIHEQSDSQSSLIINGIAADDALITYYGAITIQKNACKSKAQQENKTLLLDSRAKAISVPSLEVTNNDVQCAHGSAVGPLQEDQLLYAQSRGIPHDKSKRLLITSFFARTLDGMLDKKIKETIIAQLVTKILGE